ncbi:MAG: ABC transporter permease [Pseudomonadota bacterium]
MTVGASAESRKFLWLGCAILLVFISAGSLVTIAGTTLLKTRTIPFQPPSVTHLLGTDDMGYDILASLLAAGNLSLAIGVSAALISVIIGTVAGMLAGFLERPWAGVATGAIDVVLLIPMLPFMMVLAAYLGTQVHNVILAIALIGWCGTARAVRARVAQLRETPFIEALEALGLTRTRILFYHVLPNVREVVSAKFVLSVAGAMLSESALSFMGLGDPVRMSWGRMVHDAFQRGGFANGLWNWYLPPGLCITLCTMGFVFLGLYVEKRSGQTNTTKME